MSKHSRKSEKLSQKGQLLQDTVENSGPVGNSSVTVEDVLLVLHDKTVSMFRLRLFPINV